MNYLLQLLPSYVRRGIWAPLDTGHHPEAPAWGCERCNQLASTPRSHRDGRTHLYKPPLQHKSPPNTATDYRPHREKYETTSHLEKPSPEMGLGLGLQGENKQSMPALRGDCKHRIILHNYCH